MALSTLDELAHISFEKYRREFINTSDEKVLIDTILTFVKTKVTVSALEVVLLHSATEMLAEWQKFN